MIAQNLPSRRTGCGDELSAAREAVQVFDDDAGVQEDISIVQDQYRKLLQRRDLRISIVALSGCDGCRDEFNPVDQPEFDGGDPYLAGERGTLRECEFHKSILLCP